MSPLKSGPFRGTRQPLCKALCIFIKALKGNQGWGVEGVSKADFPTVYMLISNLTALVLELFIHWMQIIFYSFCRGPLSCRHLTVDGKMQMNVSMERLSSWLWVNGCILLRWCNLFNLNAVFWFIIGVNYNNVLTLAIFSGGAFLRSKKCSHVKQYTAERGELKPSERS